MEIAKTFGSGVQSDSIVKMIEKLRMKMNLPEDALQ